MGKRPLPATRARGPLIDRACAKTWPHTADLCAAVIAESVNLLAWRPTRAAALMALDPMPAGHVWMETTEFEDWARNMGVLNRRGDVLRAQTSISPSRRRAILGGSPVSKAEALACAHWALGLPLPVPEGDVPAFQAWAEREFGLTFALSKSLGLHTSTIPDRMRGYTIHAGRRIARPPEAGLIRAMDWCRRLGPFSPYGNRLGPEPFPKGDH